ncbi:nitrate/nitrite transporter [Chloroflexota bacterium]
MPDSRSSKYRWLMLTLSAATGTFVVALPFSCMPVLLVEISEDLSLSLVQIGSVWGIASLSGVFVSILAGILGDRFGVNRVLSISCLLIGIIGASRGLSNSFSSLMIIMFTYGIVRAMLPVNITKMVGLWFKGQNLGLANGIIGMGMGLGLMLGPLISASYLSPLLGGWRNVLFLYGGISVIMSLLWFVFAKEPYEASSVDAKAKSVPVRQVLSKLLRIRALWLLGFTLMFRIGSIIGMAGYLPLYLRKQGWAGVSADNALAAFYAISTISVIPLSSLSDRLGSRKAILFPALLVTLVSFSLIPAVNGVMIWVLLILAGIFMDGFMSIIVTLLLETDEIGQANSGAALGLVFTIAQLGGVISPPLGNSFAGLNPGLPFIFWATLSVIAMIFLTFIKETGWRRKKDSQN